MPEPVLIAGAGIGGLTLALALGRRGIPSLLLERAERLEETGAGIQLSPNAGRVLDGLGLAAALDAVATFPEAVRLADGRTGRPLASMPLGKVARGRYGAPYRVMHRADLQRVLLQDVAEMPEAVLRLRTEVVGAEATPAGVTVHVRTSAGEIDTVRGRMLVGADGVRSAVRTLLAPGSATSPSGFTAWRTLIPVASFPAELVDNVTHLWLSRGAHLVAYRVAGGAKVNLVLVTGDRMEPDGSAPPAEAVRALAPALQAIVEVAETWNAWPLFAGEPITIADPRGIVLLGDAAHPVLPFIAQGAALAIEDAAVLATEITARETAEAVRAYMAARLDRWHRVRRAGVRNGRLYHLGGTAAAARNASLRLVRGSALLAGYDWLYGWRPPA
jgi:salicylate hydroxylase